MVIGSMLRYSIGIDLGGTKTEVILLHDGIEIFRKRVPTPAGSYASILQTILLLVDECRTVARQPVTIGIGMPGSLTIDGLVKNSNTVCLNGKPFKADLEPLLQQEVMVMNDANCFALSEAVDGAGSGYAVVFGIILGTGVGGGVVINRQVVRGCNGIAGEWGHNPLPISAPRVTGAARDCYCGKTDCIETFLCGAGMVQSFAEMASAKADPQQIARLLACGDVDAARLFALYCRQLAASLATVINVLDPDVVVLGGGLSNFPDFAPAVEKWLPDYVFSDRVMTRILPNLHGDSSGVRGAAWLWPESLPIDAGTPRVCGSQAEVDCRQEGDYIRRPEKSGG